MTHISFKQAKEKGYIKPGAKIISYPDHKGESREGVIATVFEVIDVIEVVYDDYGHVALNRDGKLHANRVDTNLDINLINNRITMRTIKFRGKRLDNGEWMVGGIDQNLNQGTVYIIDYESGDSLEVAPSTVGQFTGLSDKNGTEIYEGDILLYVYSLKNKVDYWGGAFGYWINESKRFKEFISLAGNPNYTFRYKDQKDENFEVIGNIHDNPELFNNE